MCGCPRDALCDLCRAGSFDNLAGVAACRGELWADTVSLQVQRDRPWPPHDGKAAAIARRKVADLTSDPVLLEQLAERLAKWAARRWNAPVERRLI